MAPREARCTSQAPEPVAPPLRGAHAGQTIVTLCFPRVNGQDATVVDRHPSASFSATVRVRLEDRPGAFAALAAAIAEAGGSLGAIDLVRVDRHHKVRDVTVLADGAEHLEEIAAAMRAVEGVAV